MSNSYRSVVNFYWKDSLMGCYRVFYKKGMLIRTIIVGTDIYWFSVT